MPDGDLYVAFHLHGRRQVLLEKLSLHIVLLAGFPGVKPTKLVFHKAKIFYIFSIKLGHFIAQAIFSYVGNTQFYQQKSKNKEKQSLVGLTLVTKSKKGQISIVN